MSGGHERVVERIRGIFGRKRKLLFAVTITAAVLAVLLAGVLHVLLADAASVGLAGTLRYAAGLWLAFTGIGASLCLFIAAKQDLRLRSRVVVAALVAGTLVLCGVVPAATWWTFAVDHTPRAAGAPCPGCAAMAYLDGFGQWGGRDTFDRVPCDSRRDALHAQAARFTDAYKQHATLWGVTRAASETRSAACAGLRRRTGCASRSSSTAVWLPGNGSPAPT